MPVGIRRLRGWFQEPEGVDKYFITINGKTFLSKEGAQDLWRATELLSDAELKEIRTARGTIGSWISTSTANRPERPVTDWVRQTALIILTGAKPPTDLSREPNQARRKSGRLLQHATFEELVAELKARVPGMQVEVKIVTGE